jgi:hypothetical protein
VGLLSSTLKNQSLVTDQARAVPDIVQQYTRAWRLLLEYDEDRLHPHRRAYCSSRVSYRWRTRERQFRRCAYPLPLETNSRTSLGGNAADQLEGIPGQGTLAQAEPELQPVRDCYFQPRACNQPSTCPCPFIANIAGIEHTAISTLFVPSAGIVPVIATI